MQEPQLTSNKIDDFCPTEASTCPDGTVHEDGNTRERELSERLVGMLRLNSMFQHEPAIVRLRYDTTAILDIYSPSQISIELSL